MTGAGHEDNIIGLLTGHKSRGCDGTNTSEQHLREELKRKTVDLIAGVLKDAGEGGNLICFAPTSGRLEKGKSQAEKAVVSV